MADIGLRIILANRAVATFIQAREIALILRLPHAGLFQFSVSMNINCTGAADASRSDAVESVAAEPHALGDIFRFADT